MYFLPIRSNKQKSFQWNTLNQNSLCHEDTSIHKPNNVLFPQMPPPRARGEALADCRVTICMGVNASMTAGTVINTV